MGATRRGGSSYPSSPPGKVPDQSHDEDDKENEEQHLGNPRRPGSYAAEAEYRGDYRNHQKRKSPTKHNRLHSNRGRERHGRPKFPANRRDLTL